MLRTGIRAKRRHITWDKQVLGSRGKHDETPPLVGGVLTQNHTNPVTGMEGTLRSPTVLKQKRHFGAPAEKAS